MTERKLNSHGLPVMNFKPKSKAPPTDDNKRELTWGETKRLVFSKCEGHCYYCGDILIAETATVDHYLARHHGGADKLSNLVPCCVRCNDLKGNLTVERWREKFRVLFKTDAFFGER